MGQSQQVYDLSLHEDMYTILNSNNKGDKPVACGLEGTPMSITASGSGTDVEDGNGTTDCINRGIGYESVSLNSDPSKNNRISNAEVIELSDSEDDELMILAEAVGNSYTSTARVDFNLPISDTNPPVFEVPDWGLHFGEGDCNTGLFDSGGSLSTTGAHIQRTNMNGSSFTKGDIASATSDDIAVLSNNSNSLSGADHSLRIHLPLMPMPNSVSLDHEVRDQMKLSNGNRSDWISLGLGDSQSENNQATAASPDLHLGNQLLHEISDVDPMDDHATWLLGLTDGMSGKASRPRSDLPFTCPKQDRSVRRRRRYLSVDSD